MCACRGKSGGGIERPPQLALSPAQKAPTPEGPPKKLQMRAHLPFNGHNLRRTREAAKEKQILQVLALFLLSCWRGCSQRCSCREQILQGFRITKTKGARTDGRRHRVSLSIWIVSVFRSQSCVNLGSQRLMDGTADEGDSSCLCFEL